MPVDRSLESFCRHYWKVRGRRHIRNPERLAMECRRFYGIEGKLTLTRLRALVLEEMGIATIGSLPSGVEARGVFFRSELGLEVLLREDDSDDAKLFTLAHELREIIGATFKEVHPRMVDVDGMELETQADAFAATLILGENAFQLNAVEYGLDVIRLSVMYNRSVITIIRRIVKDLTMSPQVPRFWGAIYVFRSDNKPGFFRAGGSCRSPKFDRRSRGTLPNACFAKRGQLVAIRNHLGSAFNECKSVYIESLTGTNLWGDAPLSVVIRPHVRKGNVDSVIVIAVPREEASVLRDQILRCRPVMLEESFQII